MARHGWAAVAGSAIVLWGLGCGDPGARYVGRWECTEGKDEWFDIAANGKSFLVKDEGGKEYVATLQDDVVSVQAGGLAGTVALVIEDSSGDLLCPGQCTCKRFRSAEGKAKAEAALRSEMERICDAGGKVGDATSPGGREKVLRTLADLQTRVQSAEAKKVLDGLSTGSVSPEILRVEAAKAGLVECALLPVLEAGSPSEALDLLDSIRVSEKAYRAEWDSYTATGTCPGAPTGREPAPWPESCRNGFNHLGWAPDGKVACSYRVDAPSPKDGFAAQAECDLDGDGVVARYRATQDLKAHALTPASVR